MVQVYKTQFAKLRTDRLPDYVHPRLGAAAWLNTPKDKPRVLVVRGLPGLADARLEEVPATARKTYENGGRTADFRTRGGGVEARFDLVGKATRCFIQAPGFKPVELEERVPVDGEDVQVLDLSDAASTDGVDALVAAVAAAGSMDWEDAVKQHKEADINEAIEKGVLFEPILGTLQVP